MVMIALGIVVLFLRSYGALALNTTSWARCQVHPDPHFTTWHGNWYDYHGGCDLVLISNPLLDFHIRTKDFGFYSGVEAAAIKIGGDKMEVQALATTVKIFVNNFDVTGTPPATVGGYQLTVLTSPPQVKLTLLGGQYINITHSYTNNLQVNVWGHGSDFGASEGLCANWAANAPNNLIDRDGVTIYPLLPVQNAYGEEWEVDSTQGDPLLFQINPLGKCNKNYTVGPCVLNPRSPECLVKADKAKVACSNVTTVRDLRANCEFDVITTGDVGFANTIAYTDPDIADPKEMCIEIRVDGQVDKTCSEMGGKCVWRCDKRVNTCVDNLCKGPYDGCSCALPLKITRTPTMKPVTAPIPVNGTKSPTNAPVRETSNSTRSPTKRPSRAPVKVNATSAPTMKPTRAPIAVNSNSTRPPTKMPSRAPVKGNATRAPTKSPTKAPVKPTKPPTKAPVKPTKPPTKPPVKPTKPPVIPTKPPTRKPTKAPVKPCCWFFFCFGGGCGFLQRLLGLC